MNDLEELIKIPEVDIDLENNLGYKFVQLRIGDKNYIYGRNVGYHCQLVENFKLKHALSEEVSPVGGGSIKISYNKLTIGGKSEKYGKFEVDTTKKLFKTYIEENLKGYSLNIYQPIR